MKQILLTTALFCALFPRFVLAQTQHPLYEALALRKYFTQPVPGNAIFLDEGATVKLKEINNDGTPTVATVIREDVRGVLAPYCGGEELVNQETVNRAFEGNPFMVIEYTSNFGLEELRVNKADKISESSLPSSPVGFIADGIARFLVKRTKEELTLAFFADFKRAVQEDKSGFFQHFFVSTQQMLLVIDTEVYQFQMYLEALREAFISDMRFLPGNLSKYLRDTGELQAKPNLHAISIDFFNVVQMNIDGIAPVEMLRFLADKEYSEIQMTADTFANLKNMAAGLHFVNHISESVFDPENGRWYSSSQIRKALSDPITLRLYMGLLWHHARAIPMAYKNGSTIDQLIAKAAVAPTLMSDWQQLLNNFGENVGESEVSFQARRLSDSSLSSNFTHCLKLFTQILNTANTLNKMLDPGAGEAIEMKYLQLLEQIGSLHLNVRQKHYSAAIGNTAFILDILMGNQYKGRKELLQYGMFIAAVAEAENATEVQNALELFALPAGSSKAKKVAGTFSVAINAYAGGSIASEQLRTRYNPEVAKSSAALSLAAPLGFSVNWGKNWGTEAKPKNGSIGVFFPVIDVGAIYAFRFDDSGIDNLPPLEWKNIVAPGVYLVVDPPMRKLPLSLGLGGQLGPLLRKIEENGSYRNRDVGGYRIGAFATIDIPINYLKLSVKN
jgi:hypothetical protein